MGEETVGPIAEARELRQALPWGLRRRWTRRFHPGVVAAVVGVALAALASTDRVQKEMALFLFVRQVEAAATDTTANRYYPAAPPFIFQELTLLVEYDRPQVAERVVRTAVLATPEDVRRGLLAIAAARAKRGDARQASALIDEATDGGRVLPEADRNRIFVPVSAPVALAEAGRIHEATAAARRMRDASTEVLRVASVCARTGRAAEARRVLDGAVSYLRTLPPSYRGIALARAAGVRADAGDAAGAGALLREAEALAGTLDRETASLVRAEVAITWLDVGRAEEARALLPKVEPRDRGRVLDRFARHHSESGDHDTALRTLHQSDDLPGTYSRKAPARMADVYAVGTLLSAGDVAAAKVRLNSASGFPKGGAEEVRGFDGDSAAARAYGESLMECATRYRELAGALLGEYRTYRAQDWLPRDAPLWRVRWHAMRRRARDGVRPGRYGSQVEPPDREILSRYLERHRPEAFSRYKALGRYVFSDRI